jgi:hypothetical protein
MAFETSFIDGHRFFNLLSKAEAENNEVLYRFLVNNYRYDDDTHYVVIFRKHDTWH